METLLTDFVIPFLGGLAVLSGFIGWGSAAALLSGVPEPDGGLSAGWGMALVIAFGGVLSLAGAAVPPVLMAMVAAGVILHFVWALKGRASGRPGAGAGFSKATWLMMGFVAGCYLAIPAFAAEEEERAAPAPEPAGIERSWINRIFGSGWSWLALYVAAGALMVILYLVA